jgi:hypothetical protein
MSKVAELRALLEKQLPGAVPATQRTSPGRARLKKAVPMMKTRDAWLCHICAAR